jgi:spore maturation protein CgeB
MSLRILIISSLYREYLNQYHKKNRRVKNLLYHDQYINLLADTSEPVASYVHTFNRLGLEASCIIPNATFLQKQWAVENNFKHLKSYDIVHEQVKSFRPDILWLENIELAKKSWTDTFRKTVPEIKLIISSHCAPCSSNIIESFKSLDFVLTCTPGLKDYLESNGIRSYLVYHAFNPEHLQKIKEDKSEKKNELIFSGSLFPGGGYHDKRLELIEEILKSGLNIKIYVNIESYLKTKAKSLFSAIFRWLKKHKLLGIIIKSPVFQKYEAYGQNSIPQYSKELLKLLNPPVFGIDMFRLLQASKITLNIHGDVAGNSAGNMRLFEVTGMGSCLLTDNKENMNDLFVNGEEVVVYDDVEDCIRKVKWLLENEKEREKIAKAGQERTLKSHNIEVRCRLISDIFIKELHRKHNGIFN